MWLLRLHFAISILCLLTFIGFREVFKETIKTNGYQRGEKKSILAYLIFFVPIMNIMAVIVLFVMIGMKKKDLDKKCEEMKNQKENN